MDEMERYQFKIPQNGETETAIQALRDHIAALRLSEPDSARLAELAQDALSKAEVNAFKRGMGFGVHIGKESAFDPPPLPHFTGDFSETAHDAESETVTP